MEFVQPLRSTREVAAVRDALERRCLRDWCLFVLGTNTGLRIGDLLRLRVEDVLSPGSRRRQVASRLRVREQKTGKSKDIPLNATARSALRRYLREAALPEEAPLFPSRQKRQGAISPISRVMAWVSLRRAARVAGVLDSIGTHTLRKTFGYHLYKNGVDLTRIMRLLNHTNQQTTLSYIGITQDELDGIMLSHEV